MHNLKLQSTLVAAVFAVSLGVTYVLWQQVQQQTRLALVSEFNFEAHEIIDHLTQRMTAYEQVLLGARAFFDSSEYVSREEFNSYTSSLQLNQHYPGIQGISYTQIVPANQKAQYIASIRQQGFPEYAIHPSGERDIYMVVTYIQPLDERNKRVLGYDTYVESTRRSSMDQSRDSGQATVSNMLELVQETDDKAQAGFLMFVPLYQQGVSLDTIEDRRAHLIGYVNAAFRMGDLMAGLRHVYPTGLDLEIYDGKAISHSAMMYDSDDIPVNLDPDDTRLKSIHHITVAGHDWTLAIQSSPNFLARIDDNKPVLVAVTGIVFSILLALLFYAYLRSKDIRCELQESEERWRYALEGSGDGVWDWNLQTNKVHFSRQWKAMLGHTDDEIENDFKQWESRVHPDDLQKALDDVGAHISGKTSTYINEHRMRHKDGSWRWILDRGRIFSYDKKGKPLRIIGTHSDITDQKQAMKLLNDSQNYSQMLFKQSPMGFVLCRKNGEIVDVNPAFAKIIGMSVGEALKMSYWDITPIKYSDDEQHQMESLEKSGRFGPYEKEYIHKNGNLIPVRLHGHLIEKDGESFIWSSVEDITDDKRILQVLSSLASSSASVQNFDSFLKKALINLTELYGCQYAFVAKLHPDGKHIRTLAAINGGKTAETFEVNLKGTPCQDILDHKPELISHDASKLYPESKMLLDMGVESYYGSPMFSAKGKMLGLISLMDTKPMILDSWSEPMLKIFASRISTELERIQAENKLKQQRDFNDTVVETAGNVIVILDTSGHIVKFNRAAEKLTGLRREELVGQLIWDWLIPEDQQVDVRNVFDLLIQGNTNDARQHINDWLTSDGSRRTIEWLSTILRDKHGTPTHVVALGYDITERLRTDNELKQLNATLEARIKERTHELELSRDIADAANRAKSDFLSNMSHEIRSPLTAIIGFSEFLTMDKLDNQERNKITSTIIRNGRHLLQVINDILDLAKIEAGQMEIELIDTSIFLLLGDVDSLLGMNARDKGLEFKITYQFPLPESIVTDPTYLKQILVNLCSNAIKFTAEGRIEIEISCDSDYKLVHFSVSDNGIGMTLDEISHVFDPFLQADASITRKYGGTGLGLSISRKLTQALGGELTCESKKGQGSRFSLSIANHDENKAVVINSLEDVSIYHSNQPDIEDNRALKGSILLVEDSLDNQQLISMYIRKTGALLTIAENGKQAVDIAQAEKFDLILMDMQMPVMDGLEAIIRLRASGYDRPIVSLTANAMVSDREKCEAAGADGYLTKPIDLRLFYQVLNRYLRADTDGSPDEKIKPLKKSMLDSPKYKAIVVRFLDSLPQVIDEIDTALGEKNWDELQAKSHDLKGMGGAFGHPEITELAGHVNSLVKQQNYEQLTDACAALREYCHSIRHKNDN